MTKKTVSLELPDRDDLLLLEDALQWYIETREYFGLDQGSGERAALEALRVHELVCNTIKASS